MYLEPNNPELKYVKVITTTTSEGVDKDEIVDGGKAATVTVLVTPEQAELLAHYNSVRETSRAESSITWCIRCLAPRIRTSMTLPKRTW